MKILLYVTDCRDRVITGDALALNMPNDEEREQFLDVFSETFDAGVLQMKNGDHIVVKKIKEQ